MRSDDFIGIALICLLCCLITFYLGILSCSISMKNRCEEYHQNMTYKDAVQTCKAILHGVPK